MRMLSWASTRSKRFAAVLPGVLLLISLMSGCATLDRDAHADALAAPAGLHRE